MNFSKIAFIYIFFFTTYFLSFSQQYRNPLTISPALSAGFGELRSNHFHSGIDFKTQQVTGKPVVAIADGYVSRISVSPYGYGLALYIDHPATGHTSVYGHLDSFSDEIAEWVVQQQYLQERYNVTLYPEPGRFPVKAGQQIALSGNTGSSGGPHLHFEIRDTKTEEPMDALNFLAPIPDTRTPEVRGIAIYPMDVAAAVNGVNRPLRISLRGGLSGQPLAPDKTIEAWGKIGIGIKAYDRMDGQNNIYGIKTVRLFVDDKPVFNCKIDRFSFDDTRMLNSFVDFEEWKKHRAFVMKSFVDPGNQLPFYKTENDGIVEITEERPYRFRYELEDHYGNQTVYKFTVNGKQQSVADNIKRGKAMKWKRPNFYADHGFQLLIPSGNLYADICFTHSVSQGGHLFSSIHQANSTPVPLHRQAEMWIGMHVDTLRNKANYGVVKIGDNGTESWVGGRYVNGGVAVPIRELGDRYAVSADTIAPAITPLKPEKWVSEKRIRIRLSDNKSGIANFRGEINGDFVLFTYDGKSPVYTYRFDDSRLETGKEQHFTFTVTDGAGNHNEYHRTFFY